MVYIQLLVGPFTSVGGATSWQEGLHWGRRGYIGVGVATLGWEGLHWGRRGRKKAD